MPNQETSDSTCSTNCTFSYWSVVPPTHCPNCGRCLGCGGPPVYPQPVYPRPYTPPYLPRPGYPFWYTTDTAATDTKITVNYDPSVNMCAGAAANTLKFYSTNGGY